HADPRNVVDVRAKARHGGRRDPVARRLDANRAHSIRDALDRRDPELLLTATMTLTIDIGWLAAVLLASIRVAAALALTPVLGPTSMPAPVRIVIVLAFSTFIVSALP